MKKADVDMWIRQYYTMEVMWKCLFRVFYRMVSTRTSVMAFTAHYLKNRQNDGP